MKACFFRVFGGAIALCVLLISPITGKERALAKAGAEETREFYLYLYEAGTDFPIEGVRLAIPETGQTLQVNSGDKLCVTKNTPTVTLLMYKEGYADTAVFYFPLCGKRTVKYGLYRAERDLPFIVYAEAPSDKDVAMLLNAYRG